MFMGRNSKCWVKTEYKLNSYGTQWIKINDMLGVMGSTCNYTSYGKYKWAVMNEQR